MSVKPIELTESEQEQLRIIIRKGSDWRARNRAETILMLYLLCYSPYWRKN
ncbi:MAG: hypothetical protein WC856_08290 [Methylococcaceae bacterium]